MPRQSVTLTESNNSWLNAHVDKLGDKVSLKLWPLLVAKILMFGCRSWRTAPFPHFLPQQIHIQASQHQQNWT
jgi:hypothetical protein